MLLHRVRRVCTLVFLISVLVMTPGGMVFASQMAGRGTARNTAAGMFPAGQTTSQIIIKYKLTAQSRIVNAAGVDQALRLSAAAGTPLTYFRAMSGGAHVMRLAGKHPLASVQAIAKRLDQLPEVEYAEADAPRYITMTPNDPSYPDQWDMAAPANGSYGINMPAAWDISTGVSSVVVGDIDTGISPHAEFSGRILPGYDFISDTFTANDGGGRDPDPSDPGDWIAVGECGYSTAQPSSWHGTHTAGTIAANGNNGIGVAGINWSAKILPVRVLGKCGGVMSDVIDGMRWAAGLPVPGVPANANPAKVLNLSLGGSGSCSATEQSAIDEITAAGVTVVVAAGNESHDAINDSPASCNGVITVAATDSKGALTWYSNYGASVEISAPGGDTLSLGPAQGILSTVNSGTNDPVASPGGDSYRYYEGTSMATPHVTGVVSLLYGINPALTPGQVLRILQGTVTSFPKGSTCKTTLCGSGILNAGAALASQSAVILAPTVTTISRVSPNPSQSGQVVTVKYTVSPGSGSGTPTGTVTVSDGLVSCSGTVAAGSCTLTFYTNTNKLLRATYNGDTKFSSSASAGVPHVVNGGGAGVIYLPLIRKGT